MSFHPICTFIEYTRNIGKLSLAVLLYYMRSTKTILRVRTDCSSCHLTWVHPQTFPFLTTPASLPLLVVRLYTLFVALSMRNSDHCEVCSVIRIQTSMFLKTWWKFWWTTLKKWWRVNKNSYLLAKWFVSRIPCRRHLKAEAMTTDNKCNQNHF